MSVTISRPQRRILLVDDDPQSLESTRKILELAEFSVSTAVDGQAALEQIRPGPSASASVGGAQPRAPFDVVISDVRMPRLGGLEFLRALSLCGETTPVILMTAFGRVEDAVWAMKLGAVDFLSKPFKRQQLLQSVEGALSRVRARPRGEDADAQAGPPHAEGALIGNSAPIRELRELVAQVAPTAASVLLVGESGTGKELVARLLHRQSTRARRELIALNCAAVPENLLESELFGFEKGAFTGAEKGRAGLFEAADGGTLLLDEIGDMPLSLQPKLLRSLQEGEVRRLGSSQSIKVDVRVVAATHRDLHGSVRTGAFRQDLLYRLEVVTLTVPALRDRREDIPELTEHFLGKAARRHGKPVRGIAPEALAVLETHSWPGNVRELSNVIERAVVFARRDEIVAADLPPHLVAMCAPSGRPGHITVPLGTPLRDVEDLMIRKTLEAAGGDKNVTARLLGINSRTIYRKLGEKPGGNRDPEGESP